MTNPHYDNIDDLLIKSILREASDEEQQSVQDWVSLDPANQRYFEDFTRIWEESRNLAIRSTVNEDDTWQEFQQRLAQRHQDIHHRGSIDSHSGQLRIDPVTNQRHPGHTTPFHRSSRWNAPWLKAAAIFLLLITGAWLYYRQMHQPQAELALYSHGNVLTDTLSEGTIVTLNKQSSLQYHQGFAADSRPVRLEGEAFFNVSQDKDKPFIVHTPGATIKVLGTSFNVRSAYGTTEVIVETGMVEITSGGGQHTLRVRAGEKALIPDNNMAPLKETLRDDLYNYYRTHEFICNGTPLWRLVEKLNEVYHADIVIGDDRLRNLPLTTIFHVGDDTLEEILAIVSQTLKLTPTRNGQEIILH